MASRTENLIGSILLIGLIFITALVTPWNNIEPIGLPKLATLTLTVGLAGLLQVLFGKSTSKIPRRFFLSALIALALSLLNVFTNSQFISERIFGVQGRNFGALTLICLLITSILSVRLSEKFDPNTIITAVKISSFFVAFYFFVQIHGLDRAAWVDAYGGIPSSLLGNPNLVSAFVSIGIVVTLPILMARQTKRLIRVVVFSISILEFYVLVQSNSFQGFAILFLSILAIAIGFLGPILQKITKSHLLSLFFLATVSLGYLLFRIRDSLSIDNATIQARLDYLQAGFAMGFNSPLFGRGFDYFGESYLYFRSENAAVGRPGLITDSAHNYFVDLFAFGGFPLLFSVLFPFLLVFQGILKDLALDFKQFKQMSLSAFAFRGLFLAWFGFIFQALVNPMSIPLAYLGFLLTGFLCGHFNRTSKSLEISPPTKLERITTQLTLPRLFLNKSALRLILSLIFLLLPILGFQPIIADAKFRDAIEQGNGDTLIVIALSQPKSFTRMENAAEIYLSNSLDVMALRITRAMVSENPENIRGWNLLERISSNEFDKRLAQLKIRDLDPKNPEWNKN